MSNQASDLKRIGVGLRGLHLPGLGISIPEDHQPVVTPEMLSVLAPTATYERELRALEEAQRTNTRLPGMPGELLFAPTWYRHNIERITELLRRARIRDERESKAVEGCRCLGTGLIENGYCTCADGRARFAEARQQARERLASWEAERWLYSEIPDVYRTLTFDSLLARDRAKQTLLNHLRAWQQTNEWLVLYGLTGRGKTGLACVLLGDAIRAGRSGLFVRVPKMLDELRKAFDPETRTSALSLDRLYRAPWLVLDDLGAERLSGWVLETLDKVIAERANDAQQYRTIVTTNLEPEELTDYLGHRISSRLLGSSALYPVEGDDLRMTR